MRKDRKVQERCQVHMELHEKECSAKHNRAVAGLRRIFDEYNGRFIHSDLEVSPLRPIS